MLFKEINENTASNETVIPYSIPVPVMNRPKDF